MGVMYCGDEFQHAAIPGNERRYGMWSGTRRQSYHHPQVRHIFNLFSTAAAVVMGKFPSQSSACFQAKALK
jgi:hypothetical protein